MSDQPDREPEYGPRGYLPDRAARRARKIILRAPMGLQWIIAAIVAGVVVLAAGIVFLLSSGGPPGEPYVRVGAVEQLAPATTVEQIDALVVTAAGRPRAFPRASERGLRFCPDGRRIAAADGRVWSLTGRGLDGAESLEQYPTLIHDGIVYVDPTARMQAPPSSDEPAGPAC